MRNLEPTKGSLMLVSGAAVIALLLCLAVGAVGLGQINTVRAELADRRAEVEDGRRYAQRLEASEQRYYDALEELRYLEQSVSTRAYIPTLLKQLEGLAQTVNLKVVSVRPIAEPQRRVRRQTEEDGEKQEERKPPYEGQRIEVKLEGNYSNALSFLYRLTTFPKIMTVNSVDINPGSGRGPMSDTNRLEVTFNLTAFVMEESKTAPDKTEEDPSFKKHQQELEQIGSEPQQTDTQSAQSGGSHYAKR